MAAMAAMAAIPRTSVGENDFIATSNVSAPGWLSAIIEE
jgi:hypothetical protein